MVRKKVRAPVAIAMAVAALCILTFAGEASAQETYRDAIHLPNGTRYTNCTMHGCFDGVILDHPNGDICEGIGLREFLRQRFFCHK